MSMPERYQPECPPDAHKVIRPPVKEVFATLCVKVEDSEEKNGMANVVEILSLMSKKPLILCSDKMRKLICDYTKDSEVKPEFLRVHEDGKASISYENGAIGPTTDFYDFAGNSLNYKDFLKTLEKKCIVSVDMLSMFTLRSISTVYPWDELLANQFLGQYLEASKTLTDDDIALLTDVRYGRFDALNVEEKSATAYKFLRLERKLFLQYPTEDD